MYPTLYGIEAHETSFQNNARQLLKKPTYPTLRFIKQETIKHFTKDATETNIAVGNKAVEPSKDAKFTYTTKENIICNPNANNAKNLKPELQTTFRYLTPYKSTGKLIILITLRVSTANKVAIMTNINNRKKGSTATIFR